MEPVYEGFMGARTHRSSLATLLQRDLGDSQDSILGAAQVLIDGGASVNVHDEGQFTTVCSLLYGWEVSLNFRVTALKIR